MTGAPPPDPLAELPWPKPPAPRQELSDSIRKTCTEDLGARRGMSANQRLLASMALSLGVFAVLAWLSRESSSDITLRSALFGAAGWGIVQAAVLWAGLWRPPGKRGTPHVRLVLAVVLPIAFLFYVGYAAPEWVAFGEFAQGDRARHAVACGFVGLVFSAVLSGGVLLLWRGTDPLTPGLTGALAGLVGGLGGGLAIGVACPSHEGWHACFSHGLGVLAFVALGWAVGRRMLSP